MINKRNRLAIKCIPVLHFILLVFILVWGFFQYNPVNEVVVVAVCFSIGDFIMTYNDCLAKYIVNLKSKWPFKVLSFFYVLAGMFVLLIIFGIEHEILFVQNSRYILMTLFLSVFINRIAKTLIVEAIKKDYSPIHFSDIEIRDKRIIHLPTKKEYMFDPFTTIDDSTIKTDDIFTVKFKEVYLIIRDNSNHGTLKMVVDEMNSSIEKDRNQILANRKIVIQADINIKINRD